MHYSNLHGSTCNATKLLDCLIGRYYYTLTPTVINYNPSNTMQIIPGEPMIGNNLSEPQAEVKDFRPETDLRTVIENEIK